MRQLGKAGGKPPTSTFERLVQDASRMTRQGKPYSHTNLLPFSMRAEGIGAVSGAGMIRLSLCLRSPESSQFFHVFL